MVGSFSASVVVTQVAARPRRTAAPTAAARLHAAAPVAGPRVRDRWTALAVLMGAALALYLATAAFGFAVGQAGRELALAGSPGPVLRSGHLLATPFYRIVLGLGSLLGLAGQPLATLHLTNALLAAGAVGLFHTVLVRLGAGNARAAAGAALLAVSEGLWRPAITGAPIVVALPFALGALVLLARPRSAPGRQPVIAAALLFALSLTLSLELLMLLPAVLLLLARALPADRRGSGLLLFGAVLLAAGGGAFALACLYATSQPGPVTLAAIGRWVARHGRAPGQPLSWLPAELTLIAAAAVLAPPLRARWMRWAARACVPLACAVLLVANHQAEAPSLLHPQGGPGWQRARQAAGALRDGDLLLGPTGSPLLWADELRPRVRVVDLGADVPGTVAAADYEAVIWSAVLDTHAHGGRAFIHDGAPDELEAGWRRVARHHGVTRERLTALLDHEFVRRPVPALGPGVVQLLPRR